MPWDDSISLHDQRRAFLSLVAEGSCSFRCACGRFAISRKTGYKWLRRAEAPRPQPPLDRSRRPTHSPGRISDTLEQRILHLRDSYHWGARKIRALLCHGGLVLSTPTVHQVLRRHGRVVPAGPRCGPHRFERPLPNDLWQMDFKGPLLVEGRPRYLLSIEDDHSRYALACRLCPDQTMASVWPVLWGAFGHAGLPRQILTDNGFAPRGPSKGGLSWLEGRLARLGIESLHGRPYHPQTQGKDERFHRTLKAEVIQGRAFADLADCQRRFDPWREVYNHRRPHEALALAVPASRYRPSGRPFPEAPPAWEYGPADEVRKVSADGSISFRGRPIGVGKAFRGERVAVRPTAEDGGFDVYFGTHRVARAGFRAENHPH
jgi:transposase InsO family protein